MTARRWQALFRSTHTNESNLFVCTAFLRIPTNSPVPSLLVSHSPISSIFVPTSNFSSFCWRCFPNPNAGSRIGTGGFFFYTSRHAIDQGTFWLDGLRTPSSKRKILPERHVRLGRLLVSTASLNAAQEMRSHWLQPSTAWLQHSTACSKRSRSRSSPHANDEPVLGRSGARTNVRINSSTHCSHKAGLRSAIFLPTVPPLPLRKFFKLCDPCVWSSLGGPKGMPASVHRPTPLYLLKSNEDAGKKKMRATNSIWSGWAPSKIRGTHFLTVLRQYVALNFQQLRQQVGGHNLISALWTNRPTRSFH